MGKLILGFSFLFICAGAGMFAVYEQMRPKTHGHQSLAILQESVKISTEENGIAKIEASNEGDLYRAFGYTFARDRLEILNRWRNRYLGQRAKYEGEKYLEDDRVSRSFGLYRIAPQAWQKLKKSKKYDDLTIKIENFVQGLNSYIEMNQKPKIASLIWHQPEPFKPEDVLGITLEYLLSSSLGDFIKRKEKNTLRGALPESMERFLFADVNRSKNVKDWLKDFDLQHLQRKSIQAQVHSASLGSGRVYNEKALFIERREFFDEGLDLFYQAHLKTPNYEYRGFFLPMVPFPLTGFDHKKLLSLNFQHQSTLDFIDTSGEAESSQWESFELESGKTYGGQLLSKWTASGPLISFFHKKHKRKIWKKLDWHTLKTAHMPLIHLYELSKSLTSSEVHFTEKEKSSIAYELHSINKNTQIKWQNSFIHNDFLLKKTILNNKSLSYTTSGKNTFEQKTWSEMILRSKKISSQKAQELTYFRNSKQMKNLNRKMLSFLNKSLVLKEKKHKKMFSHLSDWDGEIETREDISKFFFNWQKMFSKKLLSSFSDTSFEAELSWDALLKILDLKNFSIQDEQKRKLRSKIQSLVTSSFSQALFKKENWSERLKNQTISLWEADIPSKWRQYILKLSTEAAHFLARSKGHDTSFQILWQPEYSHKWLMKSEGCRLDFSSHGPCTYGWKSATDKKIISDELLELHPSVLSL